MKTHWLQNPNKNYLGHWDLPNGKDTILTIESAQWEEVTNPIINTSEAKRVVRFQEKGVKPFICNEVNAQTILKSTGVKFMEDIKGQKIQLYVGLYKDKRTKEHIDCLRIRDKVTEVKKNELTPECPQWDKAKKAVADGNATFDTLNENYTITEENFKLLKSWSCL